MISPGLRIGRYEVGKRLGKGGFGVVHVARDVDLDREIAIKVLKPEYRERPQIVQRFIKEARAAAKIGHPGIVTVFECGQILGTNTSEDGNAYIAMELLVGESLSDRLLEGGRMELQHAIEIARQLAAALAAAHAAGIIHRDLKPDNVFLVRDAAVHGGERVKVLDFGVAKLMESGEDGINTHSQMMLGTPKYMAPEQARSAAKVDHRGDIYTLGCMFFEMLSGRAPFSGDSGEQLIAHQKKPPPSVRSIVPSVPPHIDALIRQMMAKSPDERPASMGEVGDALGDVADEPETVVRKPIETARPSGEITTVAESTPLGRREKQRLVLAAISIALIVVTAVVIFMVMRSGDTPRTPTKPVAEQTRDAAQIIIALPPGMDASEIEVDAEVAVVAPTDTLRVECKEAADKQRWGDLMACAEKLQKLDQMTGDRLYKIAHDEMRAEAADRALGDALENEDWKAAKVALEAIPPESVYSKSAIDRVTEAEDKAIEKLATNLEKVKSKDCKGYEIAIKQATGTLPKGVIEGARKRVSCTAGVVQKETWRPEDLFDQTCAKADDTFQKGVEAFSNSNFQQALPLFEAAFKCKGDANTMKFIFASACKSKNIPKAKSYWKKMSPSMQNSLSALCTTSIPWDVLNAP